MSLRSTPPSLRSPPARVRRSLVARRRRLHRAGARRGAAEEIRRHQGLLRRLRRTPTTAACCASRSPSAATCSSRSRARCAGTTPTPETEAVRLRRREDVFLHPAGQAGHRRRRCRPTRTRRRRRCFSPAKATSPATSHRRSSMHRPGSPAGSRALKLVPKAKQRDYDWLVLVARPGHASPSAAC